MKESHLVFAVVLFLSVCFLIGIFVGGLFSFSGIWVVLFLMLILGAIRWKHWWILGSSWLLLLAGFALSISEIHSLEARTQMLGDMTAWGNGTYAISGTVGSLIRTNDWSHTYSATLTWVGERTLCTWDTKDVLKDNQDVRIYGRTDLGNAATAVQPYNHTAESPLWLNCLQPIKIALVIPPNLHFMQWDTFEAVGSFRFPKDTQEFAAQKQLWYQGIIAEFRIFSSTKSPPKHRSTLVQFRNFLDEKLQALFPQEGYQVLSGILLGRRNSLDTSLRDDLKNSGLMHIMVVSGSNVMMIIIVLSLLFRMITPWIRIGIVMISIVGFTLLVGGDAPVWRAALMGIIGYGFQLWGYRSPWLVLPFFVAAVLALIRPLSLVYDIGFQLSFLSVVSIIVFAPLFRRWFSFLGVFFDEVAGMTLAATLGTLPITVYYFGAFPIMGIFANIFVGPCIPLAMYSGILAVGVQIISPGLATIIGYLPWILVKYILEVIHFFWKNFPSLSLELGNFRNEWIVVTLTLFAFFLVRFWKIHLLQLLVREESSSS